MKGRIVRRIVILAIVIQALLAMVALRCRGTEREPTRPGAAQRRHRTRIVRMSE